MGRHNQKHPYDEWFNGELHLICNGVHFHRKHTSHLVRDIKRIAREREEYLVHVRSSGPFIYILNRGRSKTWKPFVGFFGPSHRCVKRITSQPSSTKG